MRLYLLTSLLFLYILPVLPQTSDVRTQNILKSVADRINDAGNIKWDFSLTISYPGESDTQFLGEYVQSKDHFRLNVPEYLIICNGTTQWNVDKPGKQITIYDYESPDPSDLTNPSNLLTIYDNPDFDYYFEFEGKQNGISLYRIEFKPLKADTDIFKIKLEIKATTFDIHTVEVFFKNGVKYMLDIEKTYLNQKLSSSLFSIDAKSYPEFHIEDLRF